MKDFRQVFSAFPLLRRACVGRLFGREACLLVSWLCFTELPSLSKVPRPCRLPLCFKKIQGRSGALKCRSNIFCEKAGGRIFLSSENSGDQGADSNLGPGFSRLERPPGKCLYRQPQLALFIKFLFNQSMPTQFREVGREL